MHFHANIPAKHKPSLTNWKDNHLFIHYLQTPTPQQTEPNLDEKTSEPGG